MRDAKQAIQSFKSKYPGKYDKFTDKELLTALQKKYPTSYNDLAVQEEIQPTENILQRAANSLRPIVGPSMQMGAHGVNTAAFGLPGLAMDKMLPQEAKDYMKPQGVGENIGAGVGDIGGFMVGGPEQLAAKGAERFLPQGAGFMARAMRGAGKGAAAMGSLEAPQVMAGNENPLMGAAKTALGGAIQGTTEGVAPIVGKGIGMVKGLPKRIGEIWNAPSKSASIGSDIADIEGQVARSEAQASAPNMAKKGEQIVNKSYKNVNEEFQNKISELEKEQRGVFKKHTPIAKERLKKLTSDTYDTYGKILDQGEQEAMERASKEGINLSDAYREEVINPTLDTIEKTGAKTPTSEKLKRMFQPKEGLSDSSYQKADESSLNNFNNLDTVEKMKALRSSLYKEGSDDFVQTQYSDLHQKFVGKYSPSVAKANESYGPMKQALRWGSKNIKQFNEHEVKRVTDIVQKYHQGSLDETTNAYLKTLKEGRGEFKGSDITKLEKGHQKALDAINNEIDSTKKVIQNLESQNLEDIATVRQGGMQSTLDKQNILQKSAGDKSKIAQLKLLKQQVDRDVKTRDDLIRYGIITGLATLGVGKGIYSLARAFHEK